MTVNDEFSERTWGVRRMVVTFIALAAVGAAGYGIYQWFFAGGA